MEILIVDDDVIALEILKNALECSGYCVLTARDGREALDIFHRQSIRFVITDWDMPNMNGVELCRAIREQSRHGYVFIILLTSHGQPDEIVEGMSAGADDFIVKPFNRPELLVRIRAGERILSLETREVVIFVLAKLAESRDPETGKHLERVQRYCQVLAEALAENPKYAEQIDAEFVQMVYQTSPLHDIGKVGIPDAVLLKSGRLSEQEFDVMKRHTEIGAQTLDAALQQSPGASFLRLARDIALFHHERWDGTGYPHGLAGENIPLAARIVSVADVYDALTSKRIYKEASDPKTARENIVQNAGSHFDPDIVKAFVRVEPQFNKIRQILGEADGASSSPGCRQEQPAAALMELYPSMANAST